MDKSKMEGRKRGKGNRKSRSAVGYNIGRPKYVQYRTDKEKAVYNLSNALKDQGVASSNTRQQYINSVADMEQFLSMNMTLLASVLRFISDQGLDHSYGTGEDTTYTFINDPVAELNKTGIVTTAKPFETAVENYIEIPPGIGKQKITNVDMKLITLRMKISFIRYITAVIEHRQNKERYGIITQVKIPVKNVRRKTLKQED